MPDFSKQQRDFLKGPGNKENFNETNFSGYDQANIAASPSMGGSNRISPLQDNGDKDGIKRDADGKIPTQELDNITLTANSPETIRKNVKANVKGAYFGPKGEEKDKGRYTPAARKKEVSSQDYRIYQRTRKS